MALIMHPRLVEWVWPFSRQPVPVPASLLLLCRGVAGLAATRRMKEMKRLFIVILVATLLGLSTLSNAALIDNGNNLIYDTNLNITWYDPVPTAMTWDQAMAWAAGLTAGGTTAGSWSLPSTLPVNGSTFAVIFPRTSPYLKRRKP